MRIVEREVWSKDTELLRLAMKPAMPDKRCQCGTQEHWVELIDHESCIVGRIDTVMCTKCNEVQSFNMIR